MIDSKIIRSRELTGIVNGYFFCINEKLLLYKGKIVAVALMIFPWSALSIYRTLDHLFLLYDTMRREYSNSNLRLRELTCKSICPFT